MIERVLIFLAIAVTIGMCSFLVLPELIGQSLANIIFNVTVSTAASVLL